MKLDGWYIRRDDRPRAVTWWAVEEATSREFKVVAIVYNGTDALWTMSIHYVKGDRDLEPVPQIEPGEPLSSALEKMISAGNVNALVALEVLRKQADAMRPEPASV